MAHCAIMAVLSLQLVSGVEWNWIELRERTMGPNMGFATSPASQVVACLSQWRECGEILDHQDLGPAVDPSAEYSQPTRQGGQARRRRGTR